MKKGRPEQYRQGPQRRSSQSSNPEFSGFNPYLQGFTNPNSSRDSNRRPGNWRGRGGHQEANFNSSFHPGYSAFDPYSPGSSTQNPTRSPHRHYGNPRRRGRGGSQEVNTLSSAEDKPFYSSVGSLLHGGGSDNTRRPRDQQYSNRRYFNTEEHNQAPHQGNYNQGRSRPQYQRNFSNDGQNQVGNYHQGRSRPQNQRNFNNSPKHHKQNHSRQEKSRNEKPERYRTKSQNTATLPKMIQGGKVLLQRFLNDSRKVAGEDDYNSDESNSTGSDWEILGSMVNNDLSQDEDENDSKSFVSLSLHSDRMSSCTWNSKKGTNQNRISIGSTFPKVAVYWDIENCRIPKGKSSRAFVKRVRDAFYEGYQEEEFVVVCDVYKEKKEMVTELSNAQVEVEHVISESKNAADEKLRQRLRSFAETAGPQSRVVLITSDFNFSGDLRDLRYKKNMNVILIHSKMINSAMMDFANENILFEDFVSDLPSLDTPVNAEKSNNLLVKNLSFHTPDGRLKIHLNKIFENCGGKFVRVIACEDGTKSVVMKFPAQDNAVRARNRFSGYDVFGRKIKIDFYSPEENDKLTEKKRSDSGSKKEATDDSGATQSEPNTIPCWVIVNGDVTVSEDVLKRTLQKTKLSYIFFQYTIDDSGRGRCCIQYPSQNQAKKVVKTLRDDLGSRINADIQKTTTAVSPQDIQPSQKSELDRLKEEFIAIRDQNIERHKLTKIEMINQAKTTTKAEERAVINFKINMMDELLNEFQQLCTQLLKKLNASSVNQRSLKLSLIAECRRLTLGSPVYAIRSKIINAWKKESVTIITGPPGIGKSTQIVQYLLEESSARSGIIAVIEPYKICAVTHACSVAKQYGSAVGAVAGYKILINPKQKLTAKLIYMTDEILLSEFRQDRELKDYSCIVIDEIQERSDYTEILLPLLKNLLKHRADLKIVLISGNENINSLTQFFSPCANVSVLEKTFPVQVIWQPKGKKSTYTEVVIRIVQQILNEHKTGDILAFLPHPSDVLCIETILRHRYQNSGLFIKGFHPEITLNEVNKFMSENSCRRVVLATSICENALSLKNIKFVIDCGVTKEIKGIFISNAFISKTAAEWRRMAAGHREEGRCYRLYSKEEFEKKSEDEKKWNPDYHTLLLLLLKLGFSLSTELPFVEKIDKDELMSAWRELEACSAIQFGGLTEKGQQMAVLNISPKLAMLIADSLQDNTFSCFILFLVATLSLNSIYPSEIIQQSKDSIFAETKPDIMTLTTSFIEWFRQNDKNQHKWCIENGVDQNVMFKIRDNVMKFHAILRNELGIDVPLKNCSDQWYDSIQTTMLKFWKDNLSLLENPSTHTYMCLKTGKKVFPLFAYQLSSHPKYVIFDTLVKNETGEFYMLNAIPLDETFVKVAADDKDFGIEKSLLKLDTTISCVLRPIGHSVLANFLRKNVKSVIEEMNRLLQNKEISIEGFCKPGEIHIQAEGKEDLLLIQKKVENILEQEREALLLEKFQYQIGKNTGLRAQIGTAGCVHDLLFPDDYCEVIVDVTGVENVDSVARQFEKFGHISHLSVKRSTKDATTQLKLKFNSPDQAKAAVNYQSYKVTPCLQNKNPNTEIISEFEVMVVWVRRRNLGNAVLNFEIKTGSILSIQQALLQQALKPTKIENVVIIADPSSTRIILKNLNPLVTKEELTSFVKSICRKSGVSLRNIELPQEPGFLTSREDLQGQKDKLLRLVTQYVEPSSVKLNILDPEEKDDTWKALVKFEDPQMGNFVMEDLNQGAVIDGVPLHLKTFCLTATIHCSINIQSATEEALSNTLRQINLGSAEKGNELKIFMNPGINEDDVAVEIRASNLDDYINNCYHISKLIQGETISIRGLRMHFFEQNLEGKAMIEEIARSHEVLIQTNRNSKCLHLWGDPDNVKTAKEKLEKFISERIFQYLNGTDFFFGDAPEFLNSLVEKFGSNFIQLSVQNGCQDIDIDLHQHKLYLYGPAESVKKAITILEELKKKFMNQKINSSALTSDECPVCLGGNVTNRKHYRLEYCGHAYCFPCIAVILANSKIPFRCFQKNCNKPFASLDFTAFEREFQSLLCDNLNEEVRQFIRSSCEQIILCPTPLCEGILPVSQNSKTLACALCGNLVCTSCQTVYHYGQTCSNFKTFKP